MKNRLDEFHDKVETIYKEYMDALIDGELNRGKGKSNYSEGACSISSLYGTEYAIKILKAIPDVGIVKSKAKSAAKKRFGIICFVYPSLESTRTSLLLKILYLQVE